MNRFSSLLTYSVADTVPGAQARAESQFPSSVQQSNLVLRLPTAAIRQIGTQVILGIATYSRPELSLLDELDASLGDRSDQTPAVEVFNVLDCRTMEDFKQFIPELAPVLQTPVVGLIVDGQLVQQESGLAAVTDLLRRHHLLDPAVQPMSTSRG